MPASKALLHRQAQDRLQPVVEPARAHQGGAVVGIEQPVGRRAQERLDGAGGEQIRMLGREAQLQELGQELELDQAAAHVLEVPRIVAAVLAEDARAHGRHVAGQRLGVARREQGAADRRLDPARERRIAGDRARAGQRLVLPGLRGLQLIALEVVDRAGYRTEVAGRSQPGVDLVQAPLRRSAPTAR